MPEPKDGVIDPAAPAGKDGVKVGDAPTPEALLAANKVAEQYRKEAETLKEEIASTREELAELNEKVRLSQEDRDRKAELTKTLAEDKKALAKRFRAQAEAGDKDAAAWVAAAEAIAEEKFAEFHQKSVKEMTEREMARDFKTRDEMLATHAAKRNLSVEEFKKQVNPYAKHYPKTTYSPSDQLRLAIELMEKEEGIAAKGREIEEEKKKNSNFRENGTGHDSKLPGTEKKDFSKPGAWKDAKTPQEREQALYSI